MACVASVADVLHRETRPGREPEEMTLRGELTARLARTASSRVRAMESSPNAAQRLPVEFSTSDDVLRSALLAHVRAVQHT